MKVSVIYVAYRTPLEMLRTSIESVESAAAHAQVELDVLVADNGGAAAYGEILNGVRVVGAGENLGFGHAVNQAISAAHGEHVLLMNPDSVADLELFIALRSAQGAFAPTTLFGALLKNHGNPQVHAYNIWWSSVQLLFRRRRWAAELDRIVSAGIPTPIARLCGAGLYARKADLVALGPFNTDFFLYGEDVDLSLRAKAAAHRLVLVPDAVVDHDAGRSSDSSSTLSERAQTDAHLRLLATHQNRFFALLGRADAVLSACAGAFLARTHEERTRRRARLTEIQRWGWRRMAAPLDPDWINR